MFKIANLEKKRGFTLIELLIVMSLMVILLGVVFVNYRAGQRQLTLERAANKLLQDFRRTQSMAGLAEESCKKFDEFDNLGGNDFHSQYLHSYGIYLDEISPNEYILFADCDGNGKYEPAPANDEAVETIEIEKGIDIIDLEIFGSSDSWNTSDSTIVFVPPDPSVFIIGTDDIPPHQEVSGNLAKIGICLEGQTAERKWVLVNKAGLIWVSEN